MGRTMKRVPLDFDWPVNMIWPGYMISLCNEIERYFKEEKMEDRCTLCRKYAGLVGGKLKKTGCPDLQFLEPPKGDGYQMWETTSEGSPQSPVFKTLDELAEWCAENATTFADNKATKEAWKKMLQNDFVFHREGNATFI